MAFIPENPDTLNRMVRLTSLGLFIASIFFAWASPALAMTFAVSFMGWLGAELMNYSILTFYFMMAIINLVADIIAMGVVGHRIQVAHAMGVAMSFETFLIITVGLSLPVKVLNLVWVFFLRRSANRSGDVPAQTHTAPAPQSYPVDPVPNYNSNPTYQASGDAPSYQGGYQTEAPIADQPPVSGSTNAYTEGDSNFSSYQGGYQTSI